MADAILSAGAEELAASLHAVWRRLGLNAAACPVVLAGGLLRPGGAYAARVQHALDARLPGVRVVHAESPARGAALLAARLVGARR